MRKIRMFSKEDCKLLEHLFRVHGKPEKSYGSEIKYFRKIAKVFNSMTNNSARTPVQLRNFHKYRKRDGLGRIILPRQKTRKITQARKRSVKKPLRDVTPPPQPIPPTSACLPPQQTLATPPTLLSIQPPTDFVYQKIRSISPVKLQKTSAGSSSSGYSGSESQEYRYLDDNLPKPWEYTDISSNYLSSSNDQGGSGLVLEQPNIFDDIGNFSMDRASTTLQERNGMSSDLVAILADQARQHHKLKMKLLKEKFRKVDEAYKMKMCILENELEMKRKEHEGRMDVLAQKYKKLKQSTEE